jgi:hypothetical protein
MKVVEINDLPFAESFTVVDGFSRLLVPFIQCESKFCVPWHETQKTPVVSNQSHWNVAIAV